MEKQGDKDVFVPQYRLSVGLHDNPSLVVTGFDASQGLRQHIRSFMMTNYMPSPEYKINQDAGAFFQGGYQDAEDDNCGFIYIEFWKSAGTQAWIDHLNKTFKREVKL